LISAIFAFFAVNCLFKTHRRTLESSQ
jgi:hypothetical protein